MRIFTYGTLMRGFWNHSILGNNPEFISSAVAHGTLYAVSSFPGAKFTPRNSGDEKVIFGELYEVDCVTVAHLDRLEGYDSIRHTGMYLRVPIQCLTIKAHEYIEVQAYEWNRVVNENTLIPSGDYRTWCVANRTKNVGMKNVER